jgi:ribose transport system substrate-binding protein
LRAFLEVNVTSKSAGLPDFVGMGALPVSRDNVLEAWKTVYNADAPASVTNAYKK